MRCLLPIHGTSSGREMTAGKPETTKHRRRWQHQFRRRYCRYHCHYTSQTWRRGAQTYTTKTGPPSTGLLSGSGLSIPPTATTLADRPSAKNIPPQPDILPAHQHLLSPAACPLTLPAQPGHPTPLGNYGCHNHHPAARRHLPCVPAVAAHPLQNL